MRSNIDVFIKLGENGKMPEYKSKDAAGCDLYATKDFAIRPGETVIMPLDFIIAMDPNIEAQIRPRSGLSLKTTLRMPNSIGTIDSDYRNEVGVLLTNNYNIANLPYQIANDVSLLEKLNNNYKEMTLRQYLSKNEKEFPFMLSLSTVLESSIYVDRWGNPYGTIYIKKDERICQMVFNEYKRASFISNQEVEEIGNNRGGGFGHTDELYEIELIDSEQESANKYAQNVKPKLKLKQKPKRKISFKKSKYKQTRN